MKLAIASDDGKYISNHFGRATGFSIFDIVQNEIVHEERRDNIGRHQGTCGSCNHAEMIENIRDCTVLISHGMGMSIPQSISKKCSCPGGG